MPDIILLTDERYEAPAPDDWYVAQLQHEEQLLADALEALGLRTARVAWSRPDYPWHAVKAAVFRSTWDYFDRFPEFSQWLEATAARTRLFNEPALLRWNVDKHYLSDLADRGVAVPPTRFIERGDLRPLREHLADCPWPEAILKPVVSGAARHTYRLAGTPDDAMEARFADLIRDEAMMLQPFLGRVLTEGELSLIVIGGRCTHAVRKRAKPGDFRVQDDHGGTVHPHVPAPDEVAFAEQAVATCPAAPLYARVDAVRDADGRLALMELELIEPELFFRFHPPAAAALAAVIAEAMSATQAAGGAETGQPLTSRGAP